jgi:hypothetical protein
MPRAFNIDTTPEVSAARAFPINATLLRSRTGPSRSQKGIKRRSPATPGHPQKSYVDETKESSLLTFFKSWFFRCSFGALLVPEKRPQNGGSNQAAPAPKRRSIKFAAACPQNAQIASHPRAERIQLRFAPAIRGLQHETLVWPISKPSLRSSP